MKFLILGAGSWGLAIAQTLASNGQDVLVYCRTAEQAQRLSETSLDPRLPGFQLHSSLNYSSDLMESLGDVDAIVLGCPSTAIRSVAAQLAQWQPLYKIPVCISLIKGVEKNSLARMSQILESDIPWLPRQNIAVLSGPSHAEEVVRGIPTSVVIASESLAVAKRLQDCFMNERFRVYTSDDVLGVEIAGAVKNVIAIATGILDGLGFGDNTKGALLSRGLAEISRLGECLGGNVRTFAGLSGLGDLVTTCISQHSRNRYVGEKIGQGQSIDQILGEMNMVAEGVNTAQSTWQLAEKHQVEMPITQAVYQVLYQNRSAAEAATALMKRDPKAELI